MGPIARLIVDEMRALRAAADVEPRLARAFEATADSLRRNR